MSKKKKKLKKTYKKGATYNRTILLILLALAVNLKNLHIHFDGYMDFASFNSISRQESDTDIVTNDVDRLIEQMIKDNIN